MKNKMVFSEKKTGLYICLSVVTISFLICLVSILFYKWNNVSQRNGDNQSVQSQINKADRSNSKTRGSSIRVGNQSINENEDKNKGQAGKPDQKKKQISIIPDFKRITGDLLAVNTTTRPDGDTSVQSFAKDDKYYYYIQKLDKTEGHLRITRVCYDDRGAYTKDHMDLKYFSHATNLDCSVYEGKTYLWTGADAEKGSDMSHSVTCFEYKKGTTLYHHGDYTYRIPMGNSGRIAQNVYPAVSPDSEKLCVRYTYRGKQYFQTYRLTEGISIKPKEYQKNVVLSATIGDFQGFDFDGTSIYTVEGSPTKDYVGGSFAPTVMRKYSLIDGVASKKVITGAAELKFREPEGIKITQEGQIEVLFASRLASGQYCNTYVIR